VSLAIQGSRLVASRRGGQVQIVKQKPIDTEDVLDHIDWSGRPHTPSSDRSQVVTRHIIGTAAISTLLSATLTIESGTLTKGRCYVRLVLEDRDQVEKGTLFQGSVYAGHVPFGAGSLVIRLGDQIRLESNCSLASVQLIPRGTLLRNALLPGGWTGTDEGPLEGEGFLRTISGDNPAAGTFVVDEAVPNNARWKLRGVRAPVTTDSTVQNRRAQVTTDDGTIALTAGHSQVDQTASTSVTYFFTAGFPINYAAIVNNTLVSPIAPDLKLGLLPTNWNVQFALSNGAAGDNIGGVQFFVEEWIEP